MTNQTDDLKTQIKAEIHSELAAQAGSGVALYINVALLVAVGLVSGFILGRTYERRLIQNSAEFAQQRAAAAGPRPQSQPPMENVGGGDPMAQVLALREKLESDPNDLEALVELAHLNTVIGRNAQAIEFLQRAVAIDPSNVDLLLELGSIQHGEGRGDDALQTYHLAEAVDSDRPWRSQLALAVLYTTVKQDNGLALEYFRKYLENAPADDPYRADVEEEVARLTQLVGGEARRHGPEDVTAPVPATPS